MDTAMGARPPTSAICTSISMSLSRPTTDSPFAPRKVTSASKPPACMNCHAWNHAVPHSQPQSTGGGTVDSVALCSSGILRFEALCPKIGDELPFSSSFPHRKPTRYHHLSIGHCQILTACCLLSTNLMNRAEPCRGILKSDNVDVNRAHALNKGGVPCPSRRSSN